MRGTFILFVLTMLVVVVGCSPRVAPSITTLTKTIVRDSIITKEVPRIVHVNVPGEKIVVKEYVQCDSLNKVKPKTIKARGKSAFVDVTFKSDGSVTAEGGCDSLQTVVTAMDKEIFRLKHESNFETTKVVKPVYILRRIDIFCRCFTSLVVLFLLIVLFNKIKPLKSFLP